MAASSSLALLILAATFADRERIQPWLQVLHDGEQDGVGRRRWKPEQKARATTNKSNDALAVALLDYAEQQGIISNAMRKDIQISTATRYLANPAVRQAMGIASTATSDKVDIVTDTGRFAKVLAHFFDGIRTRELHSRSVTTNWLDYASKLNSLFGTPVDPKAPSTVGSTAPKPATRKPPKPTRAKVVTPEVRFIAKSSPIIEALNKLESFKLSSLYNSLTAIRLDEHPALLTTGAWVFIETLTALHGRVSTDFVGYIVGKFGSWNIAKNHGKDCKLSLEYISQHGNAQKHSGLFTAVDARNLNNHFHVLESVIAALINDCVIEKNNNL